MDLDFNGVDPHEIHNMNSQNDSELDQSQIENGVTEIEHGTITGLDVAKVLIRRLGPKDPQVNPVFGKG